MSRRFVYAVITAMSVGACFDASEPETGTESAYLASDAPQPAAKRTLELSDCGTVAPDPTKPHPIYPACPVFTPTAASCAGVWMEDGAADLWVEGNTVCLGKSEHISQCTKCNKLKLPNEGDPKAKGRTFDKKGCTNRAFIACANAGLLPKQGTAKPCFIDGPGDIGVYPPFTDRNWTGREMCWFAWLKKPPAFQTPAELAACKRAAGCPDTYAAAPAAVRDGCTCVCSAEGGCDTSACDAEIADDALCVLVTTPLEPEPTTSTSTL